MIYLLKFVFFSALLIQNISKISGQSQACRLYPNGTYADLTSCIKQEIQDYINNDLDLGKEFENQAGISIGSVIAILIIIIIIPNLIIMGLIFLFCYCCRCGAFYRGNQRDYDESPYRVATMTVPSPTPNSGPGGYKPQVPAQPEAKSDAPWSNNQRASYRSNWPWNRNGNNNANNGQQNPGYRTEW